MIPKGRVSIVGGSDQALVVRAGTGCDHVGVVVWSGTDVREADWGIPPRDKVTVDPPVEQKSVNQIHEPSPTR